METPTLYLTWCVTLVIVVTAWTQHNRFRLRRDIFQPVNCVSVVMLLMFWGRSAQVFMSGSPILGSYPFDREIVRAWALALIYATVSYLCILVGNVLGLGRRLARRLPQPRGFWNSKRTATLGSAFLFVGLFAVLRVSGVSFSGGTYAGNRTEMLFTRGTGSYTYLTALVTVGSLALYACAIAGRRLHLLANTLAALSTVALLGTSLKSSLVFYLTALFAIRHYYGLRVRLKDVLLLLAGGFIAFHVSHVLRTKSTVEQIQEGLQSVGIADTLTSMLGRLSGIDALVYIVKDTPEAMDYQYGRTYVRSVAGCIPWQLWHDKPLVAFGPEFTAAYLGNHFHGTMATTYAPTAIGEAYVNFSLAGIVLLSIVAGLLLEILYVWSISTRTHTGAYVYSICLPFLLCCIESHSVGWYLPAFVALNGIVLVMICGRGPRMRQKQVHFSARYGRTTTHFCTPLPLPGSLGAEGFAQIRCAQPKRQSASLNNPGTRKMRIAGLRHVVTMPQ